MSWIFLAAVVAPLAFALVNLSDTYLIKHVAPIKALFLFSGLFSIIVAVFFFLLSFFGGSELRFVSSSTPILLLAGILEFVWLWFYLKALDGSAPVSTVVPFFQFVGIFSYIFAMLFLRETLELSKIFASLSIILGGVLLIIDFKEHRFRIKQVSFMIVAALLISLGAVFFKTGALEETVSFTAAMFWTSLGSSIAALFVCIFFSSFRREFKLMMQKKHATRSALSLNASNEILNAVGLTAVSYASLRAPIAKVYVLGTTQYAYVFLLSLIGTLWFPKILREDLSYSSILPKILALLLMFLGVWWLEIGM